MTYIEPRTGWPRTTRRIAAVLRRDLRLPEATISSRGDVLHVRWTEGPTLPVVRHALLAALPARTPLRLRRVYRPATFAAALLLPEHQDLVGWARGRAAWQEMRCRDHTEAPLLEELQHLGTILTAISGVPADARIGYHRRRWDVDVYNKLEAIGEQVLRAIAATP